jgi:hypothetical protein
MDGGMSLRQPQANASHITKDASYRPFRRALGIGTNWAVTPGE